VRRGQCQLCDTVPPTLVRLTRRALDGGPAAPSSPLFVALQGQTVTSGRRERHPRRCQPCAPIPAPSAPGHALLQPLQRCWARGDGMPLCPPLYPVRTTVSGSLGPAGRRPVNHYAFTLEAPCLSTGHVTAPRPKQDSLGRRHLHGTVRHTFARSRIVRRACTSPSPWYIKGR
jgi:hypothetical protein